MTSRYDANDNIYVNIVFDHADATYIGSPVTPALGQAPIPAEYNVTKTIPILERASDYYLSIIRFDIPLDTVPLFIMPIIPNQVNPNLTPMIIGISSAGIAYPESLIFFPQQQSINIPVQNQPTQVISYYYYVYSYQNMINMINIGLTEAWLASPLAAANPTLIPPFFFFDPATSLINLVVSTVFTTDDGINNIFINTSLRNYLDAFNYFFYGFGQTNGEEFRFELGLFVPTPDKAYYLPGTPTNVPPTYYKFVQDYPSIAAWTSLRKIILSSNTMPVAAEYVPVGGNNNAQSGVAASFPIVSDFVPNIEIAGAGRSIAYYNPTSQYRLVNLISDSPLQKIDLKIYWEDTNGNIYPLLISLLQQASVKLAFIRKSLYKPTNQLLYK